MFNSDIFQSNQLVYKMFNSDGIQSNHLENSILFYIYIWTKLAPEHESKFATCREYGIFEF